MDIKDEILTKLPYKKPFLFVDSLDNVSGDEIVGRYRFQKDEFFYSGHFPGNPITPGVILTETAAQIGLVSMGIHHLLENKIDGNIVPLFSSAEVNFLAPVYPGEEVIVKSTKKYFRFNKLKCQVVMTNEQGEKVLDGYLSGFIVDNKK